MKSKKYCIIAALLFTFFSNAGEKEAKLLVTKTRLKELEEVKKYLLTTKPDPDDINYADPNNSNNTALHFIAARTSSADTADIIQQLVSMGANINKQNNKGDTPLHSALYQDEWDNALLLVENKFLNPNLQNNAGLTPLRTIIERLKTTKKDKKANEAIINTIITKLLEKGSDLTIRDSEFGHKTVLEELDDPALKEIKKLITDWPVNNFAQALRAIED